MERRHSSDAEIVDKNLYTQQRINDICILLNEGRTRAEIVTILDLKREERRLITQAEMVRMQDFALSPAAMKVLESAVRAKLMLEGTRDGASVEDRKLALAALNSNRVPKVAIQQNFGPKHSADPELHAKLIDTIDLEGGESDC